MKTEKEIIEEMEACIKQGYKTCKNIHYQRAIAIGLLYLIKRRMKNDIKPNRIC